MFQKNILLLLLGLVLTFVSCKKYEDKTGPTDPRLVKPYCNDPQAVNYNWDFPGTPDNNTCVYPTDVFKGEYTYTDSIYDANSKLVLHQTLQLTFIPSTKTKLFVAGLCPTGALSFTASRRLRADADTTVGIGQLFCRTEDTVSGYISRENIVDAPIRFSLTVNSDTGIFTHRGSAIKR